MIWVQGLSASDVNFSLAAELFDPSVFMPLSLGVTTTGTIAKVGQQQAYEFIAAIGQRLMLDGRANAAGLDLRLTTPSNHTLWQAAPDYDQGPLTITQSGTYRLTVRGTGSSTGDYGFSLLDIASSNQIELDQSYSGTLDLADMLAAYRFQGAVSV